MTSSEPDWAAMAEANDREHRRTRLLKVGSGVLGVLVVGGLVATAVALQGPGGGKHTSAGPVAATAAVNPDGSAASGAPSASASASASAAAAASASASAAASGSASGHPSATAGKSGSPASPQPAPGGPGAGQGAGGFQATANTSIGSTDGHNGPTLALRSSADSYAQSNSVAVDTNRSFTVSAMVRNNAPTGGRAVITQSGGSYFSFDLGRDYWTGHNQWVFKVQTAAGGDDKNVYPAFSQGDATTGQWTLLAGVYDAGAKTISLYVNGALASSKSVPGIWSAGGTMQIGRTMYKSAWTDFWDGAIADVQLWNQALPASAVAQLNSTGGVSAGVPASTSWLLP